MIFQPEFPSRNFFPSAFLPFSWRSRVFLMFCLKSQIWDSTGPTATSREPHAAFFPLNSGLFCEKKPDLLRRSITMVYMGRGKRQDKVGEKKKNLGKIQWVSEIPTVSMRHTRTHIRIANALSAFQGSFFACREPEKTACKIVPQSTRTSTYSLENVRARWFYTSSLSLPPLAIKLLISLN